MSWNPSASTSYTVLPASRRLSAGNAPVPVSRSSFFFLIVCHPWEFNYYGGSIGFYLQKNKIRIFLSVSTHKRNRLQKTDWTFGLPVTKGCAPKWHAVMSHDAGSGNLKYSLAGTETFLLHLLTVTPEESFNAISQRCIFRGVFHYCSSHDWFSEANHWASVPKMLAIETTHFISMQYFPVPAHPKRTFDMCQEAGRQ